MLRDLEDALAHTRVGALAAAIALALVFVELVNSLAYVALHVVGELATENDRLLGASIFGGRVYDDAVATVVAFVATLAALALLLRSARRRTVACPACLSAVPRGASVCRFCSSDLVESA
ncbi:MAG: hypothetical protein M3M94_05280 [Actinomycetota bacterium]|nr:hypothetical protein [Actinomycetota bacterium]